MDSYPTLMGAYYRQQGENRVTDVFATVLQSVPAYVDHLAETLELRPGGTYEVKTQVRSSACIIDLEIRARSIDGQLVWLLWSEHKVGDPVTVDQLSTEAATLETTADGLLHKLIAITLDPPTPAVRAHAEATGVTLLRWHEVVRIAERTMNAIVETAAQASPAAEQKAAVEHHMLREWADFARNELEGPVEPLSPDRVRILPEADKAWQTIEHLLQEGFREACEAVNATAPRWVGEQWRAGAPAGSWLANQGCKLYAVYDPDDSWIVGGRGNPAFVVGIWADEPEADALRKQLELRQRLRHHSFTTYDARGRDSWIGFVKAQPLAELADRQNLDQQSRLVGEFCTDVLQELISIGSA